MTASAGCQCANPPEYPPCSGVGGAACVCEYTGIEFMMCSRGCAEHTSMYMHDPY